MLLSYERFDIARANKGMTLDDVARAGNTSKATLWKVKAGREIATMSAHRIANALGVSVEDLLEQRHDV